MGHSSPFPLQCGAVRLPKLIPCFVLVAACSGLSTLTPELLDQAEQRWSASKPAAYHLVVAMEGDRVERGEYDVEVKDNVVISIKRNGSIVDSKVGQDYSMDGLFKIIRDEVGLAKTPSLFGAPAGYSAYLMASFDRSSGRLQHYRRSVGGISNSIDIEVLQFDKL
jgi:hypothetical protein